MYKLHPIDRTVLVLIIHVTSQRLHQVAKRFHHMKHAWLLNELRNLSSSSSLLLCVCRSQVTFYSRESCIVQSLQSNRDLRSGSLMQTLSGSCSNTKAKALYCSLSAVRQYQIWRISRKQYTFLDSLQTIFNRLFHF